jgi:hypothetical protein
MRVSSAILQLSDSSSCRCVTCLLSEFRAITPCASLSTPPRPDAHPACGYPRPRAPACVGVRRRLQRACLTPRRPSARASLLVRDELALRKVQMGIDARRELDLRSLEPPSVTHHTVTTQPSSVGRVQWVGYSKKGSYDRSAECVRVRAVKPSPERRLAARRY